jgi:hypothetical protein
VAADYTVDPGRTGLSFGGYDNGQSDGNDGSVNASDFADGQISKDDKDDALANVETGDNSAEQSEQQIDSRANAANTDNEDLTQVAAKKPDLKQFDDACKTISSQIGRQLSKDEKRSLHDAITGQGFGFHEIVNEGICMFGK